MRAPQAARAGPPQLKRLTPGSSACRKRTKSRDSGWFVRQPLVKAGVSCGSSCRFLGDPFRAGGVVYRSARRRLLLLAEQERVAAHGSLLEVVALRHTRRDAPDFCSACWRLLARSMSANRRARLGSARDRLRFLVSVVVPSLEVTQASSPSWVARSRRWTIPEVESVTPRNKGPNEISSRCQRRVIMPHERLGRSGCVPGLCSRLIDAGKGRASMDAVGGGSGRCPATRTSPR